MYLDDLIKRAEETTPEKFYLVETDLFMEFYYLENKPSFAVAFMGISSWMGTSQRSGVWTYYESTDPEIERLMSGTRKYRKVDYKDEEKMESIVQKGFKKYSCIDKCNM